jgi:hypothetical protein
MWLGCNSQQTWLGGVQNRSEPASYKGTASRWSLHFMTTFQYLGNHEPLEAPSRKAVILWVLIQYCIALENIFHVQLWVCVYVCVCVFLGWVFCTNSGFMAVQLMPVVRWVAYLSVWNKIGPLCVQICPCSCELSAQECFWVTADRKTLSLLKRTPTEDYICNSNYPRLRTLQRSLVFLSELQTQSPITTKHPSLPQRKMSGTTTFRELCYVAHHPYSVYERGKCSSVPTVISISICLPLPCVQLISLVWCGCKRLSKQSFINCFPWINGCKEWNNKLYES